MKLLFSLLLTFSIGSVLAQSTRSQSFSTIARRSNLFFDLGVGTRLGSLRNSMDYKANVAGIHIDGGIGFMFNPIIGIKGDLGYDGFGSVYNGLNVTTPSTTNSSMLRLSLHGILSLSNWGKFGGDKFSLNFHAGFGWSTMKNQDFRRDNSNFDDGKIIKKNDDMGNIIVGFTPMYNFNKVISLTADLSYVTLVANDRPSDWSQKLNKGTTGYVNFSLGMNIRIATGKYTSKI